MVKPSTLIFGIFVIPLLFITELAAAPKAELVGVYPFSNQRAISETDWIGYYIRARIENNLKQNSDWKFHPLRTIHFWKKSSAITAPEKLRSSILISGSYQQVIDVGVIYITVWHVKNESAEEKRFKVIYAKEELSSTLDSVSLKIGRWIDPDYNPAKPAKWSGLNPDLRRDFYTLVAQTNQPDQFPESRLVIGVMDKVNERSAADIVVGVVEGALVLSTQLNSNERESLFARIETLLKKAIQTHPMDSELYALLAETYYLKQSYATWIEKTAKEALQYNDQNDLAYLMLLLVSELDTDTVKQYIDRIDSITPFFWDSLKKNPKVYQKGILKKDLHHLGRQLGRI